MSEQTNDWQQADLKAKNEQAIGQKYLQNPLSVTWSKLVALFSSTALESESSEAELLDHLSRSPQSNSICKQDLYPRFTDRIDPSLYYTVFFPHQRH
jgi:hypothetical protein